MTQIEIETMNAIKNACREYNHSQNRIDWEQRRYEIAKSVLDASWDGRVTDLTDPHPCIDYYSMRNRAEVAVMYADALIDVLKCTNNK